MARSDHEELPKAKAREFCKFLEKEGYTILPPECPTEAFRAYHKGDHHKFTAFQSVGSRYLDFQARGSQLVRQFYAEKKKAVLAPLPVDFMFLPMGAM